VSTGKVEVKGSQDEVHRILVLAQADLERLLHEIATDGRGVDGIVGDSDPRLALEDSLRQFAADEIVIVNPPGAEMEGLEEVATARALKDVDLPVAVVTVPAA
jgi:hypothetical protein